MKRIGCSVIQDLLPLYADGCLSEESRNLIEEHIGECPECQKMCLEMTRPLPIMDKTQVEAANVFMEQSQKASWTLKKGMKKIRRFWLETVIMVVFMMIVSVLLWNQFWGYGICFTNIHELWMANAFMKCLYNEDYEKAYEYMDFERKKDQWINKGWFETERLTKLKEDGLKYFLDGGEVLSAAGRISEYRYLAIETAGNGAYRVRYLVLLNEEEYQFVITLGDDGIQYISDSENILSEMSLWSEYLWQEYRGCYFDRETGEYHYYEK